jgi:hypothetical protein
MFIGHDRPPPQAVLMLSYFAPGVLVLAEGDAAGEGLATGLGVLTGAVTVTPGEGDAAAGLAVGVVESLTVSLAQPAANAIEVIVRRRSAVRLMIFIFEILITFCLVRARLKSGMMIARTLTASNGCSHRMCAGISAWAAPKASSAKWCLHD